MPPMNVCTTHARCLAMLIALCVWLSLVACAFCVLLCAVDVLQVGVYLNRLSDYLFTAARYAVSGWVKCRRLTHLSRCQRLPALATTAML